MYGDFSRLHNAPWPRYSAVWAQQGRPQLDSDLNAQTAIFLNYLRSLTTDIIGPFGGHVRTAGFKVHLVQTSEGDPTSADLVLSPGHYYVYGLRLEVRELDEMGRQAVVSYRGRPRHGEGAPPLPEVPFLVYVAVWERTVTALQDPNLLEPALGLDGPDTTVRSEVVWDIVLSRTFPDGTPVTGDENRQHLASLFSEFHAEPRHAGALRARARTATVSPDDPSILPAESSYRGVENQLYRVEIHGGGEPGAATFKWSANNASVNFPIESLEGSAAVLGNLGRDARTDLEVGDWVEVIDDTWTPHGTPSHLVQVSDIDPVARAVTLSGDLEASYDGTALHPFLRRWDQHLPPTATAPDGALRVRESAHEDEWHNLEDGVQIQFVPRSGEGHHTYERGDYWLIPARTITGQVLWPGGPKGPVPLEPQGPARYRAPLALVRSLDPDGVVDMRSLFSNVTWPVPDEGTGEHTMPVMRPARPTGATAVEVAPPPRRFRLLTVQGANEGRSWELAKSRIAIGRDRQCDIVLEDPSVSRQHAVITRDEDRLTIEALPSPNPVRLNGQEIGETTELASGDRLVFGQIELLVQESAPAPISASGPGDVAR